MTMKILAAFITLICVASISAAETINFDKMNPGALSADWQATQTGTGAAKWIIETDNTAPSKPNVLKQLGQATYPVCIKNDIEMQDGFVEVKFKPLSGEKDQAGGLIWRAKDANNYYVARANALENNITIYDTVNGRRTERKRINMKVTGNEWHTLRVDFKGSHFTVTFDGQKAIEWDDTKFTEAGKVGLWTKADSVTSFDDFTFSAAATSPK
jgi:hypothetical protein